MKMHSVYLGLLLCFAASPAFSAECKCRSGTKASGDHSCSFVDDSSGCSISYSEAVPLRPTVHFAQFSDDDAGRFIADRAEELGIDLIPAPLAEIDGWPPLEEQDHFFRVYWSILLTTAASDLNQRRAATIMNLVREISSPEHEVIEFAREQYNQSGCQITQFSDMLFIFVSDKSTKPFNCME